MRPAAAAILLVAMSAVSGCTIAGGSSSWHPPREAVLWAETAEGASDSNVFTGFGASPQGTLYLYDQQDQRLLYTGWVEQNQSLRLYADRAVLLPKGMTPSTRPASDPELAQYVIAQYPRGQHVQAYVMRWFQGVKTK